MSNKRITSFTDNAALVDVINKQTSKESKVMVLVRHLVLTCLRHNILFRAKHIPGFLNLQADHLPGGGTTYNGLYGEAPPERGTFFRLQVYKRVGISQV